MTYLYIKRGFWEALDRIRALYAYRDRYSYIRVTFRKKQSEENTQNYIRLTILRKLILIFLVQESYTRRSSNTRRFIIIQGEIIEIFYIKLR